MPKFYVQCGPIQLIVDGETGESAALVGIDRVLRPHWWIYDDPGLSDLDRRTHLMLEALLNLESTIRVNERGFDRADGERFGTPELIDQWHGLAASLAGLFGAANLLPGSLAPTLSDNGQKTLKT